MVFKAIRATKTNPIITKPIPGRFSFEMINLSCFIVYSTSDNDASDSFYLNFCQE